VNLQRVEWRADIPAEELEPFQSSTGTCHGILHDTGFSAADVFGGRARWPEADVEILRKFMGSEKIQKDLSDARATLVAVREELRETMHLVAVTSLDALEDVCRRINESPKLGDSITLAASWLCEWIDYAMKVDGECKPEGFDYREYCLKIVDELEAWRSEDDELAAWAWGVGAEILDLYERCSDLDEEILLRDFCEDIDDPEIDDKGKYVRHLFAAALSYIHGWTNQTPS
jgi:hypothetical protein